MLLIFRLAVLLAGLLAAGAAPADSVRASAPVPSADQADREIAAARREQDDLMEQIMLDIGRQPDEALRLQKMRLFAEIQRRLEGEGPLRKHFVISPDSDALYTDYCAAMNRIISDAGRNHFPHFGAQRLYGDVHVMLTITASGQVLKAKLAQSSGNETLDHKAIEIVQSVRGAPFSAAMRKGADQIVFLARLRFIHDDSARSASQASAS